MRGLVFESFGEPDTVLSLREVAAPLLPTGHVQVRMLLSPVNPSDLMTIRGVYGKRPSLPAVPGYEGVGIVTAANAGLFGKYLLGKRVAVLNSVTGNWQEQVSVPAKSVIPLSSKLSLEQAAVFFINPATAWLMTRTVLKIPRAAWLLQSASGSAVGKMVIRLGRQQGFSTVNLVRRPEQIAELQSLGADKVLAFDPDLETGDDLARRVRECTGTNGVPFAIDPVGGRVGSAMLNCLGERGRMLVYGTLSAEPLEFSSRVLMTTGSQVEGFWLSQVMQQTGLLAKLKLIGQITQGILAGTLSSPVGNVYPLDDWQSAVRAAEQPGKSGKVLLRIGAP